MNKTLFEHEKVISMVRIRPLVPPDMSSLHKDTNNTPEHLQAKSQEHDTQTPNNITQINDSELRLRDKHFKYSRVFRPTDDNLQVFRETVLDNIKNVARGESLCVFTYGQTSSGKTYTLLGNTDCLQENVDWLEAHMGAFSGRLNLLSDKRVLREQHRHRESVRIAECHTPVTRTPVRKKKTTQRFEIVHETRNSMKHREHRMRELREEFALSKNYQNNDFE